jgi:hypothetical protein
MNAAVLTIEGVCKPQAGPAAAKTAGAKSAAAPAKAAAKAAPAECKTVITRAEFEKLADALSPHVTPQLKKQLAAAYPGLLAFAQAAQKQNLDKTERFKTLMAFYRVQLLGNELKRQITEDATKLTDDDIDKYYQEHLDAYQQFNLDRVFVPHFRQPATEAKTDDKDEKRDVKKDEKLTPEQQQQKTKEEQDQEEAKLAESLRTRAVAGEDFAKLEKDAYDAAGMKMEPPSTNLPKVRRNSLPPGQLAVFELKEGEFSQVINDSGGHYVYRVKAIEQMPLDDQLKNEIRSMLQGQRQREGMEKYQKSYKVLETNEAYFGPPAPAGMPPGASPRGLPNRMPPMAHPPAQQQTPPPPQPPAASPN